MKYCVKVILFFALVVLLAACASAPNFNEVKNRNWLLAEVRFGQEIIAIDRSRQEEGLGEIFTLRFDDERISGTGAPNRYFAPYALANRQGVSIGIIAGTQMASLFEPEDFKEYEYFTWLHNVERWNLVEGNLELYAAGSDDSQVVLIFAPAE